MSVNITPYCNLKAAMEGRVAEVVTAESSEALVRKRIVRPLANASSKAGYRLRGVIGCYRGHSTFRVATSLL